MSKNRNMKYFLTKVDSILLEVKNIKKILQSLNFDSIMEIKDC